MSMENDIDRGTSDSSGRFFENQQSNLVAKQEELKKQIMNFALYNIFSYFKSVI
jgi:hypothetical protein